MMAPDGTNHLWGLSQMSAGSSADVPYLGPKGSQMVCAYIVTATLNHVHGSIICVSLVKWTALTGVASLMLRVSSAASSIILYLALTSKG